MKHASGYLPRDDSEVFEEGLDSGASLQAADVATIPTTLYTDR